VPRGAEISRRRILEVIYICENGCKRQALPKEYGNWHVIYTRINRRSKSGVPERVFLLAARDARPTGRAVDAVSPDPAAVKVRPGGTGALKKRAPSDRQDGRRADGRDTPDGEESARTGNARLAGRE
jgi:transposase